MRRGRERPLGAAFRKLADEITPPDPAAALAAIWPEVVGEAIAGHTRPVSVTAGELLVECDSSVYAEELQLLSRKVLKAIGEQLQGPAPQKLRCTLPKGRNNR